MAKHWDSFLSHCIPGCISLHRCNGWSNVGVARSYVRCFAISKRASTSLGNSNCFFWRCISDMGSVHIGICTWWYDSQFHRIRVPTGLDGAFKWSKRGRTEGIVEIRTSFTFHYTNIYFFLYPTIDSALMPYYLDYSLIMVSSSYSKLRCMLIICSFFWIHN